MDFASDFAYLDIQQQEVKEEDLRNAASSRSISDSLDLRRASTKKRGGRVFRHQVDTNILSVTFSTLDQASENILPGDPFFCAECGAVLNRLSKLIPQSAPESPVDQQDNSFVDTVVATPKRQPDASAASPPPLPPLPPPSALPSTAPSSSTLVTSPTASLPSPDSRAVPAAAAASCRRPSSSLESSSLSAVGTDAIAVATSSSFPSDASTSTECDSTPLMPTVLVASPPSSWSGPSTGTTTAGPARGSNASDSVVITGGSGKKKKKKKKGIFASLKRKLSRRFLGKAALSGGSSSGGKFLWVCNFCEHENGLDIDPEEVPTKDTTDYLLQPAPEVEVKNNGSAMLLFLIDISGSMAVTTEVPGKFEVKQARRHDDELDLDALGLRGADFDQRQLRKPEDSTYVTRLQMVQAAVEKQLEHLSVAQPSAKVGLIAFNREVSVIGDGSRPAVTASGDRLDSIEELKKIAALVQISEPISKTKDRLVSRLWKLRETGPTALGPALVIAQEIAAAHKGSTVVLCTDGLANVGVGAMKLNDVDSLEEARQWYQARGDEAKACGVCTSVISIKGAECLLANLGLVAAATGGDVTRVDPLQLTTEFSSILANTVIATSVKLRLCLHDGMKFRNEDNDTNVIHKELGNVTKDTEVTFEYGLKSKKLRAKYKKLKSLPFQLQIRFTTMSGMKILRVITKSQKTTMEREKAEKHVRFNLLAANAMQQSSRRAMSGDLQSSSVGQFAYAAHLRRVSRLNDQEDEFDLYAHDMDNLHRATMDVNDEMHESAGISSTPAYLGSTPSLSTPSDGVFVDMFRHERSSSSRYSRDSARAHTMPGRLSVIRENHARRSPTRLESRRGGTAAAAARRRSQNPAVSSRVSQSMDSGSAGRPRQLKRHSTRVRKARGGGGGGGGGANDSLSGVRVTHIRSARRAADDDSDDEDVKSPDSGNSMGSAAADTSHSRVSSQEFVLPLLRIPSKEQSPVSVSDMDKDYVAARRGSGGGGGSAVAIDTAADTVDNTTTGAVESPNAATSGLPPLAVPSDSDDSDSDSFHTPRSAN